MTANEQRLKRTKPTVILSTPIDNELDSPRPFYWSWYRVVFKQPARPDSPAGQPPEPRAE